MIGPETNDDAAVIRVTDDLAIIQTLDFFTPVVDDPYLFGQIAAANALSDIYAMGGEPKYALNIVGFPNCLDTAVLEQIMRGGADKVMEAGAVIAGGHSIQNDSPIYGLSVTGYVNPKKLQRNYGAKPGDVLILTKPIGSGIINTAAKADMAPQTSVDEAAAVMSTLNRKAKEVMEAFPVHACTDVTGFGLLGHACEMAQPSGVTLEIFAKSVALIRGAKDLAEEGLVPAGAYRNMDYVSGKADFGDTVEDVWRDLLVDPQTSGGLLYAVEAKCAPQIIEAMDKAGIGSGISIVGNVLPFDGMYIHVV